MSRQLNVVFVDHTSEKGGAELALLRVLKASPAFDVACALVVPRTDAPDDDAFAEVPGSVSVTRGGPRHVARKATKGGKLADVALTIRLVVSALSLVVARNVRSADIIVANTTRSSVYVALAAAILRKPFATHIRDLIEPDAVGNAATMLMRKFVLPRAAAIVANSHASLDLVADFTRTHCERVVLPSPSGIVLGSHKPTRAAHSGLRFGMVARLDPWKGQDLLIDAFADAFPDGENTLVLAGGAAFGHEDYLSDLMNQAAERNVARRVDFRGHVDDVAAVIESFDVCVQCSVRPEPLGQNVLQYLAAAKPTIVSNEGGPAEWVKDGRNGLTFEPRQRSSLTDALRRMSEDVDLRDRLSAEAAETPGLRSDRQITDELFTVLRGAAVGAK